MSLLMQQGLTPYKIVLGLTFVIFVLLIIRACLKGTQSRMKPSVEIGNGQTIGQRVEQDDYFATIMNSHGTISVLADGISGLSGGRVASTQAVTTFVKEFLKLENLTDISGYFTKAARVSNTEIIRSLKGVQGGTTLVAVIISEGLLYWGAVGDSLIKIFRNGEFIDVNHKHILEAVLEERYVSREITKDEALDSPMKNQLVNYLGYEAFKNIEICEKPIHLQKLDRVLLCSDGVTNTLTEVELEQLLSLPLNAYDAAQAIIEAIEQKEIKHQDNATIIILEKGW
ncbi:PP2C family protein-serine/threonine phosphatase [Paenibacillus alba]|uniref:Protein phosphatase 2C domain-containing protein n=1 Tax=Paenibacillus alba TaxID=1197127 RepID=A0ABU6FWK1_9BACL|nr:protein phosphatase 2C domain-containing protein [Paenibacillus alba]MEC0226292.1 protein phosphatase 2C domain-containing protein [Paenibacillus alba]